MKNVFVIVFLGMCLSELSSAAEGEQAFLSWYDGWGTHTIWGIGRIQSGYAGTSVKCGDRLVSVHHVYDTHADIAEPTTTQSQEHLERVNRLLLHVLEASGSKCAFKLVPPP